MLTGKRTHNDFVKYTNGYRKFYRAVLMDMFFKLRVSKRKFERAKDAQVYKFRILERLERLREGGNGSK